MKHLIKIESTPHGVLGVMHAGLDQQYCEAGELVILKWQPSAGWGLQEAHYTDKDGNIVPIDLGNGNGVVAFMMPDKDITLGGTFKMFVSQDWTEGTNPSKGEVLTVGNNGEPTPISVDELANQITEGDNDLVDAIDRINPFKGWYTDIASLQNNHPSPQIGDYAYVKGAESTDPAAIYECTTNGSWSDSGRTADTSNVQTFASGQEVNEVHIVNDLTTGGTEDVLSAEQGKEIGNTLYGEYGFADISPTITNESYYAYSSNKINVDKTDYGSSASTRISVTPGEKFKIFGKDNPNASLIRLWCFSDGTSVDGKYSAISVADNNTDARENGVVITAPEGSAYLSIAFYQYDSTKDRIQKCDKYSSGLVDKTKFGTGQSLNNVGIINNINTDSVNDVLSAKQGKLLGDTLFDSYSWQLDMDDLSTQHYYNTNNNSIEYPPLSYANASCIRLSCVEGDKFKIFGKGNDGAVQLYVFTSIGNAIIDKPNSAIDSREDGIELTAPQNAAYLYINFYQYDSATDKVLRYAKDSIGLVTRVSDLETKSNSPLKGKNIVVFGDSLSEFKYQNKGWCDWAGEISGANFINIGIGGTQLKSRVKTPHVFDENATYDVGDFVYYFRDSHYHFYRCTVQHTGAWNSNDFTEKTDTDMYSGLDMVNLIAQACDTSTPIESRFLDAEAAADCVKTNMSSHDDNTNQIARLKDINWPSVDAIIVMGGTNDYGQSVVFGEQDSSNTRQEAGAINSIVHNIGIAYGNIPLYFVKQPVRWYPHTEEGQTVFTDDYWCDNYFYNANMTIATFFGKIQEQFNIVNHIPVCDLYYGLGWNKHNFWNYFSSPDGTHPFKGFRQIAEKIVSFIIANKVF